MRKYLKKIRGKASDEWQQRTFEPTPIEPDSLRDHVLVALSQLPQAERVLRARGVTG